MSNPPPPSYQEATGPADWLTIIAPKIPPRSYVSLCLVSKRFYRQFAPRLWNDPLAIIQVLKPNLEDYIEWYCDFVIDHLERVRLSTRSLVRSLDFRGLAQAAGDFSLDLERPTIADTFGKLTAKLPKLRCILLDNHSEVDLNALSRSNKSPGLEPLLLLSIRGCHYALDSDFFSNLYLRFRHLVYLDLSFIPEIAANKSILTTIRPQYLPHLRILKAQGQNMGDTAAGILLSALGKQLWSLDLSQNRLTDDPLRYIRLAYSRPNLDLVEAGSRFAVEGGLNGFQNPYQHSAQTTYFVKESDWSASFSHPDRYLVDAPTYAHNEDVHVVSRADGRAAIKDDSVEAIKKALIEHERRSAGAVGSSVDHINELDVCDSPNGLTHLHLNRNNISSAGVVSMFEQAGGHLESFECDSMSYTIPDGLISDFLPHQARLVGILGASHIFRPVYASNLQVLRIHHSLVTQLLSIDTDHLSVPVSTLVKSWAAETYLLPRAERAYPQAFVPDMNPRLRSLTLTGIPRRSTGPLVRKLINFLRLAAIQERAIQNSKASTRHGPQTLLGLRHIGLEFEHDPVQEIYEIENNEGSAASSQFSFFEENGGWDASADTTQPSPPQLKPPRSSSLIAAAAASSSSEPQQQPRDSESDRLVVQDMPPGVDDDSDAHLSRTFNHRTVSVWIGNTTTDTDTTGMPPPPPPPPHTTTRTTELVTTTREYTKLARNASLQYRIQPATPCHVAAGVPPGSFIFGAAWDAMLKSDRMRKPTAADLKGMVDVLGEIKRYRARTRAAAAAAAAAVSSSSSSSLGEEPQQHFHWTGTLKVSRVDSAAYYTSSKFWR
ncbi:hypothetical protein QBC47DRAFT_456887 [Echria macrotheca]|uniref:F-box domain-containing protein n=1 Tax=Echria macrotheca TaxID=438768 RepID=A0AAJ0BQP2_9PEZI|nr:hypothetical protein QBC47DRAFT_456887 [Echria macrotheca]